MLCGTTLAAPTDNFRKGSGRRQTGSAQMAGQRDRNQNDEDRKQSRAGSVLTTVGVA